MRDNAAREWFDGPLGWRVLREEAAAGEWLRVVRGLQK